MWRLTTKSLLATLAVVTILGATLVPQPGVASLRPFACLFCGPNGLADTVNNLLLFVPFGAVVGVGLRKRAVVLALCLSALVESAQVFIPGRFSSALDLLLNVLGALLGVFLARTAPLWLQPGKHLGRVLFAAAVGTVSMVLVFSATLLEPSPPQGPYHVLWAPSRPGFATFGGDLVSATLGPLALPPDTVEQPDSMYALLVAESELRLLIRPGPPTEAAAPIFILNTVPKREVLLVGRDHNDLVFRTRTRAAQLWLGQRSLRIENGFAELGAEEIVPIMVWRRGDGYCVAINETPVCNLGFTLGEAWGFFFYPSGLPPWTKGFLSLVWILALMLPIGYWSQRKWDAVIGWTACVGLLGTAPAFTAAIATPLSQLAGAVTGLVLGLALRNKVSHLPKGNRPAGTAALLRDLR